MTLEDFVSYSGRLLPKFAAYYALNHGEAELEPEEWQNLMIDYCDSQPG